MTESEKIEYKSSLGEWKEIIVSLAAFANKTGGRVVIGVDDKGNPLGLQLGKGSIEDLANKIKNHTDPAIYPSINVRTFGPGEIIELDVAESDVKPVFAFDRAYVRVVKTNQRLTNADVRSLVLRYHLPDYDVQVLPGRWDRYELNEPTIRLAAKAAGLKKPAGSLARALEHLSLVRSGQLTHAGYLCFAGKNTAMRCGIVKAARFKGKTMNTFIDMKEFDAGLALLVDEVLEFIQRHTSMEVVISGKAKREERWDYPLPALREAVINAIVHRDYQDPGNVQIRIFDDRLEVWSPGLLPKQLDLNHIGREHRSIPRNRKIAELFHTLGLIEGWGSGFGRMLLWARENGNDEPAFKETTGAFVITFPRHRLGGGVTGGVNGGVSGGVLEEPVVFLELIRSNPGVNSKDLAARTGKSHRTTERWLKQLKKQGKLEFRGAPKTGGYFVVEQ